MIFLQKRRNSSKFYKYADDRVSDEYHLDDYLSRFSIDTEVLRKLTNKRIKQLQKLLKEIDKVEKCKLNV